MGVGRKGRRLLLRLIGKTAGIHNLAFYTFRIQGMLPLLLFLDTFRILGDSESDWKQENDKIPLRQNIVMSGQFRTLAMFH